jgi:hypothetical protein
MKKQHLTIHGLKALTIALLSTTLTFSCNHIQAQNLTKPIQMTSQVTSLNAQVTLASLKFKIQSSKFKKRMQAPEFIYGECKKCFPRRAALFKRRPCFKPPTSVMGILILNL